jgi:hypothetical protein
MSDIVERMRRASLTEFGLDIDKELLDEGAAEVERLKAALREIEALEDRVISGAGKAMRAVAIARRAREGK